MFEALFAAITSLFNAMTRTCTALERTADGVYALADVGANHAESYRDQELAKLEKELQLLVNEDKKEDKEDKEEKKGA